MDRCFVHRTDLLSTLRASPFRAFKMIMIDGRQYPVPHEDFAWVTPNGTIIYFESADKPWKMLNANLVARVEFLEEQAER